MLNSLFLIGSLGTSALQRPRAIVAAAFLSLLIFSTAYAADCPASPESHVPQPPSPLNIDTVKHLLRVYHDGEQGGDSDYAKDIAAVFSVAEGYIDNRASTAKNPAVVLDIDETSLSNWTNIDLDDFGFIKKGSCSERRGFSCAFASWIAKSRATAIEPARKFFDSMRAKHIAVFFVTGRRDSQRSATVRNLHRAGFHDWAKLVTRPDDDEEKSIVPFKSGARAKIAKDYTIVATIGDQESDRQGGYAECGFKLPNPFYLIP